MFITGARLDLGTRKTKGKEFSVKKIKIKSLYFNESNSNWLLFAFFPLFLLVL